MPTQKGRAPSNVTRAPSNVAAAEDGARGGAGEVAPAAAKALLDRITQEATARIRRRLSLAERARLPYGIKHLIDVAAMHVVEGAVEVAVTREVRGAAVRLARASLRPDDASTPSDFALLKEGLSLRSSELSGPLLEEAKDLAAKKTALETVGFSSEEAMQILVAQIVAASR